MKKVAIKTECNKLLADVFTPVSTYLRLRDCFHDTILLESTHSHTAVNSYSFICINAIAGIEILSTSLLEFKLSGRNPEKVSFSEKKEVPLRIGDFMMRFEIEKPDIKEGKFAQGLFGYENL